MATPVKKRFHWGWGIVALYAGFVLFILVIVGYASFQRFDLVDKDYYAKGIDYERQIERIKRAETLVQKPVIRFDNGEVVIQFPPVGQPSDYSGAVTIFRPSAASLDFFSQLLLESDFTQRVKSERLVAGMWRIKLAWTVGGVEYYQEKEMMLE